MDLSSEHVGTLRAKLNRYIAYYRSGSEQHEHGVFPRVVWLVPDRRRAAQIEGVVQGLPEGTGRMFSVCLLDEAAAWLAQEARA